MNDEVRAEVAAAARWHRLKDVARYYGISDRTLKRIMDEVEPAFDFPNIPSSPVRVRGELNEDVRILRARGMSDAEVGEVLGLTKSRINQIRHES